MIDLRLLQRFSDFTHLRTHQTATHATRQSPTVHREDYLIQLGYNPRYSYTLVHATHHGHTHDPQNVERQSGDTLLLVLLCARVQYSTRYRTGTDSLADLMWALGSCGVSVQSRLLHSVVCAVRVVKPSDATCAMAW